MRELQTHNLIVRIQPTLFKQFRVTCESKYKKFSEVVRELIVKYVEENQLKGK